MVGIRAYPLLWRLFLFIIFWSPVLATNRVDLLRQETIDLFYHGYDNYMQHAFPEDELRPISCSPLTRDPNPQHIEINDVLGNYSLTLIDSLSTLAILASSPDGKRKPLDDFQEGIKLLVEHYGDGSKGPEGEGKRARGFDLDSKVQVFETTIRGLGGLLSSHLFATGELPIRGYTPIFGKEGIQWPNGFAYNGQLLRLAKDLADRLLPAFESATGIPYPRVNLRHGVPFYPNSPYNADPESGLCDTKQPPKQEITETCSAGAGSLVLEFTTLSRLLDDSKYERAAAKAFFSVWKRRSNLDLIGAGIDSESGDWVTPITGIGAGIDSFFEYAFKSYILLSNHPVKNAAAAYLQVWETAHSAVKRHIIRGDSSQHPHYVQADMNTGAHKYLWVDSLSAFYPGLLTLAGEVDEAETAHLLYSALWSRYSAMPERYSTQHGGVDNGIGWWGGRPEFIESAWYLYRATNDPWYSHLGEMALKDMKRRCWTECGWAGLQDVRTGEQTDRMESFFLGETAKYLFLLFDEKHPLNNLDAPFVLTTEGHPLIIPKSSIVNAKSPVSSSTEKASITSGTCPAALPPLPFTISRITSRADLFHPAQLARLHLVHSRQNFDAPLRAQWTTDPTIHLNDVESPSNFAFFPWTLPTDLIPTHGSSKKLTNLHFDLTFPTFSGDPNNPTLLMPLTRTPQGILLKTMSGVKMGLIKEPHVDGTQFRIYSLAGVTLGRDEVILIQRETVIGLNEQDPHFTRRRDLQHADMIVDFSTEPIQNLTEQASEAPLPTEINIPIDAEEGTPLISSILRNLQSLLTSSQSTSPAPAMQLLQRHIQHVALPTGPGAYLLPSLDIEPPSLFIEATETPLSWRDIYMVPHDMCEHVLPPAIPRDHQVVIVKRGGCSFSEKLAHIPAFPPSTHGLQLVIVVSYPRSERNAPIDLPDGLPEGEFEEDDEYIQPYLHEAQRSPNGVPRVHPVPMVLMNGGDKVWNSLAKAKGIGLRRKWWFESQGLKINNLVVL
jgi:hypothetical protein